MDFNTFSQSLNLPEATPFAIDPASLCAALAKVTDKRGKKGRLYRAEVVLTLLILAKLAGQTTLAGITRFNRLRKATLSAALNLKCGRLPCANTYVYVCETIDWNELNAVLCHFFQDLYPAGPPGPGLPQPDLPTSPLPLRHLAMDGKTLLSTLKGKRSPGSAVHLLELYEVESGVVLAQLNVGKKESEVTVAPRLLEGHQLAGCLISADAFHTQREWCKLLNQKGAEWLLIAKANQPGLVADLRMLFEDEANWPKWLEKRTAQSVDKAHGRLEQRRLTLSSELKEFLGAEWQGVEQVFRLERRITRGGKTRQEVIYGLLSLTPLQAGAEQVLEYIRRHWRIENRLHWRKDVSLKEDQCLSRRGQTPQVLAALNNAVLGLLDYLKVKNVPAQLEGFAYPPNQALALLVSNIIL